MEVATCFTGSLNPSQKQCAGQLMKYKDAVKVILGFLLQNPIVTHFHLQDIKVPLSLVTALPTLQPVADFLRQRPEREKSREQSIVEVRYSLIVLCISGMRCLYEAPVGDVIAGTQDACVYFMIAVKRPAIIGDLLPSVCHQQSFDVCSLCAKDEPLLFPYAAMLHIVFSSSRIIPVFVRSLPARHR